MNGPPLVPSEITATLQRGIAQLEAIGLERAAAIVATAARYGADVDKVRRLTTEPTR